MDPNYDQLLGLMAEYVKMTEQFTTNMKGIVSKYNNTLHYSSAIPTPSSTSSSPSISSVANACIGKACDAKDQATEDDNNKRKAISIIIAGLIGVFVLIAVIAVCLEKIKMRSAEIKRKKAKMAEDQTSQGSAQASVDEESSRAAGEVFDEAWESEDVKKKREEEQRDWKSEDNRMSLRELDISDKEKELEQREKGRKGSLARRKKECERREREASEREKEIEKMELENEKMEQGEMGGEKKGLN